MKTPVKLIILSVLLLFGCNDNNSGTGKLRSSEINKVVDKISDHQPAKHLGVKLLNLKTGGIGYRDSADATYQFRTIKIQLRNDTVLPLTVSLKISNKQYDFFHSTDGKFNAFLLPDTINGFGANLFSFLSQRGKGDSVLTKVIAPGDALTLKIGMLFFTAQGRPDGYTSEVVFFRSHTGRMNRTDSIINQTGAEKQDLDLILGVNLHGRETFYSNVVIGRLAFPKID